jgi:hypothetical protein
MDTVLYISRHKSESAVVALLDGLGVANPDTFGGLSIFDYPARGVAVYFDETERVRTIFLYSEGRDGHHQSVLPLPNDLSFSDTLEQVLTRIGRPQQSGVMKESGRKWVRYDYGLHAVHLEFGYPDNRISLACVMMAD